MIEMICRELELRKNYLGSENQVESIYFGGGTPSLIPTLQIETILDKIHKHFSLNIKEVTLEANPDDLNHLKLKELRALGVDRLSIGIQTFDAGILKFYNRAHTAEESLNAIALAKAAGFQKLSIDLIYGFPSENHDIWKKDLEIALAQDPGHISSYCLTVEPKTALGNWEKKGIYTPSTDDFAAEQFELLCQHLEKSGYIQYEISNFGKSGQFALHNTNYWLGVPYLGVGPSAHSFDGKIRGANISNNAIYIKSLKRKELTFSEEATSAIDTANDYILTSLRTIWGLDLEYLHRSLGFDLLRIKRKETEFLLNENLLLKENNRLLLTTKGKLIADSIAASLFLE